MKTVPWTLWVFSLCLALPACALTGCGSAGGGNDTVGHGTLTGLTVLGPSSVSECQTGTFTATADWSDNSTSVVTPVWRVNPPAATIASNGILFCSRIHGDQTVTITATFSSRGVTRTASMDVTLVNVPTGSFTPGMLSRNLVIVIA